MVYGGHNTGEALAIAFLVGAVMSLCSLVSAARMQRVRGGLTH
jgi:hypothetical protein